MADNPFLNNLKEALGVEDEPQATVRGVIKMTRDWLKGEFEAEPLKDSIEQVLQEAEGILAAYESQLNQSDQLDPEFREHVEGVIDGYNDVCEALSAIGEHLDDNRDEVAVRVEELEGAADATAHHYATVTEWNSGVKPVCPLCAYKAEGSETACPSCRAHLLIHDPNPPDLPVVTIGQDYVNIHNACAGLATGRGTVNQLLEALAVAEAGMKETRNILEQLERANLVALADECLGGLKRMAQIETSCQVADLNRGWLQASQAVLALNEVLPEVETALAEAEAAEGS